MRLIESVPSGTMSESLMTHTQLVWGRNNKVLNILFVNVLKGKSVKAQTLSNDSPENPAFFSTGKSGR